MRWGAKTLSERMSHRWRARRFYFRRIVSRSGWVFLFYGSSRIWKNPLTLGIISFSDDSSNFWDRLWTDLFIFWIISYVDESSIFEVVSRLEGYIFFFWEIISYLDKSSFFLYHLAFRQIFRDHLIFGRVLYFLDCLAFGRIFKDHLMLFWGIFYI